MSSGAHGAARSNARDTWGQRVAWRSWSSTCIIKITSRGRLKYFVGTLMHDFAGVLLFFICENACERKNCVGKSDWLKIWHTHHARACDGFVSTLEIVEFNMICFRAVKKLQRSFSHMSWRNESGDFLINSRHRAKSFYCLEVSSAESSPPGADNLCLIKSCKQVLQYYPT